MADINDIISVFDEVADYLRFASDAGFKGFDCDKASLDTIDTWGKSRVNVPETLEGIRHDLGDCRRCKLCEERHHIVFGAGAPNARLVFVGEAPGAEEDASGEPFEGADGQLLTKIIRAINMTRDQVYLCNIIKCRPPQNRHPEPEEIRTCISFLKRQLTAIRPEFICALGTGAARALLSTTAPIPELRGRFHDYQGIKVMPTYHPAYLLRHSEKKRDVWEDMKLLMKAMEP